MASQTTLFRPWVVGQVTPTSRIFTLHPRPWLPSPFILSPVRLAHDPGTGRTISLRIVHVAQDLLWFHADFHAACLVPRAKQRPLFNQPGSRRQFPAAAHATCGCSFTPCGLKSGGGPCLGACFHCSLWRTRVSLHVQCCHTLGKLCCVCLTLSLGDGAWLTLGGGAGSTSPLFAAPSPFQAPLRHSWVVAARRVAMDTCMPCSRLAAQGSLLALEPLPTLSGTIPKLIYWR